MVSTNIGLKRANFTQPQAVVGSQQTDDAGKILTNHNYNTTKIVQGRLIRPQTVVRTLIDNFSVGSAPARRWNF